MNPAGNKFVSMAVILYPECRISTEQYMGSSSFGVFAVNHSSMSSLFSKRSCCMGDNDNSLVFDAMDHPVK